MDDRDARRPGLALARRGLRRRAAGAAAADRRPGRPGVPAGTPLAGPPARRPPARAARRGARVAPPAGWCGSARRSTWRTPPAWCRSSPRPGTAAPPGSAAVWRRRTRRWPWPSRRGADPQNAGSSSSAVGTSRSSPAAASAVQRAAAGSGSGGSSSRTTRAAVTARCQRVLHHRGQLVDAAPGRRRDGRRHRPPAASRLPRRPDQQHRARRVQPRDRRRAHGRRRAAGRHRAVAPAPAEAGRALATTTSTTRCGAARSGSAAGCRWPPSSLVALTGDWQGKLMYEQQPLKMSSAEALCETEAPASFSIFACGKLGNNECDDVHSITVPYLLSYLAHGDFSTAVPGVNELQEQYAAVYGATYPDDPCVRRQGRRAGRLHAGARRHLLELPADDRHGRRLGRRSPPTRCGPPARAGCRRRGSASTARCSPSARPFVANAAGWIFTEMGRQPFVVVPNPDVPVDEQVWFFTAQAVSPGVTAAEVWTSLIAADRSSTARSPSSSSWLITRFVRRGRHHRRRRTDARPHPRGHAGRRPARRPRRDDDVLSFAY